MQYKVNNYFILNKNTSFNKNIDFLVASKKKKKRNDSINIMKSIFYKIKDSLYLLPRYSYAYKFGLNMPCAKIELIINNGVRFFKL